MRVEAYKAVAAAATQTQAGAIGLCTAAQKRLTLEWEALREAVDDKLRPSYEAMSATQVGLVEDLKAARRGSAD